MNDKTYYLNTFKVTECQLRKLVETALSRGGDYADLYFENTSFSICC